MGLLDKKIEKDLTALYYGMEMSGAVELNKLGAVKDTVFSTRGLPLHFAGNREADTVFVMLNPGEEACVANAMFNARTFCYDRSSVRRFIDSYKSDKGRVMINRSVAVDSFDLKQAMFLLPWKDSGVAFPHRFPFCPFTFWDAVENVLNQKLQLELIPYCSKSLGTIDSKGKALLIPNLEVIFDEIVARKRKYVVFGSAKFEAIFMEYNKIKRKSKSYDGISVRAKNHIALKKLSKGLSSKTKNAFCSGVIITYKGMEFHAIIAHAFSDWAFSNALPLMMRYGQFCYEQYNIWFP